LSAICRITSSTAALPRRGAEKREHVDRAVDRPVDLVVDQLFEFVVPALVDRAMERA
jgi:hypothetical protein